MKNQIEIVHFEGVNTLVIAATLSSFLTIYKGQAKVKTVIGQTALDLTMIR